MKKRIRKNRSIIHLSLPPLTSSSSILKYNHSSYFSAAPLFFPSETTDILTSQVLLSFLNGPLNYLVLEKFIELDQKCEDNQIITFLLDNGLARKIAEKISICKDIEEGMNIVDKIMKIEDVENLNKLFGGTLTDEIVKIIINNETLDSIKPETLTKCAEYLDFGFATVENLSKALNNSKFDVFNELLFALSKKKNSYFKAIRLSILYSFYKTQISMNFVSPSYFNKDLMESLAEDAFSISSINLFEETKSILHLQQEETINIWMNSAKGVIKLFEVIEDFFFEDEEIERKQIFNDFFKDCFFNFLLEHDFIDILIEKASLIGKGLHQELKSREENLSCVLCSILKINISAISILISVFSDSQNKLADNRMEEEKIEQEQANVSHIEIEEGSTAKMNEGKFIKKIFIHFFEQINMNVCLLNEKKSKNDNLLKDLLIEQIQLCSLLSKNNKISSELPTTQFIELGEKIINLRNEPASLIFIDLISQRFNKNKTKITKEENKILCLFLFKKLVSGINRMMICQILDCIFDVYCDEDYDDNLQECDAMRILTETKEKIGNTKKKHKKQNKNLDKDDLDFINETTKNLEAFLLYKQKHIFKLFPNNI